MRKAERIDQLEKDVESLTEYIREVDKKMGILWGRVIETVDMVCTIQEYLAVKIKEENND